MHLLREGSNSLNMNSPLFSMQPSVSSSSEVLLQVCTCVAAAMRRWRQEFERPTPNLSVGPPEMIVPHGGQQQITYNLKKRGHENIERIGLDICN